MDIDNLFNVDTDTCSAVLEMYRLTLCIHPYLSYILNNEDECLQVGSTDVHYLQQLSQICPDNEDTCSTLLWAEYCYAYNMFRIGRLQDVQQYIDHCAKMWSTKLYTSSSAEIARWHILMLTLRADALDAQGSTEQAWLINQETYNIVGQYAARSSYHPLLYQFVKLMTQETRLQVIFGDTEAALQTAEAALRLYRIKEPKSNFKNRLVRSHSLYAVSFAALSCQKYERAVEAATEGCKIYSSPENSEVWQNDQDGERDIFIRPSLFSMLASAEANLGNFAIALEYAHRAVDISLEIGNMKFYISATTAEQSYMETRGNLAGILLATGDFAQARKICEERKTYFSKRVKNRMGEYRELTPVLRMLGVLYCTEGYHEESGAAAKELSHIMTMLGRAFPSLQKQVKIRLRNQADRPVFKVLGEMSRKLDCTHQTELY